MTRQSQKQQERIYAEQAAKLLGRSWVLSDDRECPDFIVTEEKMRFGLEIASLFVGPKGRKGASSRAEESASKRALEQLRKEFEAKVDLPLIVKLVGSKLGDSTCPANMAAVVPGLLAMDLPRKEIGYQDKFVVDDGPASLTVYVTRALRPDWYDVAHRVGWVDTNPVCYIADMIAEKAGRLTHYKENTDLEDIRLLLIADRIMNSGKMALNIPPDIGLGGFKAVYFFSYPEKVIVLKSEA